MLIRLLILLNVIFTFLYFGLCLYILGRYFVFSEQPSMFQLFLVLILATSYKRK